MAQPTNTYDSYDMVGIREDLSDVIHNIAPHETPFFSKCAKTKATNTYHEWQTDSLRAAASNAHIEGDETTATARSATTRLGNYTQIFKDAAIVSGTDDALNKAGRGSEMDYEVAKIGKEIRLDVELALFANNARVAGNATTARELAGMPAWLTTNTQFEGTGADPTGDGTDARTDGATRALTQAMLNTALQDAWTAGGNVDTIYCGADNVTAIAGFTGSNNQRNTVDKRELSYAVDVYMTSFGTVEIQPSRLCRSRDMFVVDSSMWKVAIARPFQDKPLAISGDYKKRQVLAEMTLVSCNEAGSAGVFDLS